MKKLAKIVVLTLMQLAGYFVMAQTPTNGDEILGKWANEDKTRILEFVKNGTVYEAIIREAPDKNLVGKKQITQLKFNNSSYKGMVFLPKRNKTLPCTLSIDSQGRLQISAKAGLISQSQTWTRIP